MNSAFNYGQKPCAAILSPGAYRQIQSLLTRYFMACIRRQLRWVVLKRTSVKRKKCPSAALKIPNNRKNAAFLKNQAMNIAVCILFLMNTAIVLKRRYKPSGKSPAWNKGRCKKWVVHNGGLEACHHGHEFAFVSTGQGDRMAGWKSKERLFFSGESSRKLHLI